MMNRRRIAENPQSVGNTILRGIITGIGLGVGFYLVNKIGEKIEKKHG